MPYVNRPVPGPVASGGISGFIALAAVVLVGMFVWNVAIPGVEKFLNIGGHGDPPVPWRVPLPCVITATEEDTTTCEKRYIRSSDMEQWFSGYGGNVYAKEFLNLNRTPVVVIFPKNDTAAERQKFEATMKSAVVAMGEWERNGNTGQFESDDVRDLVQNAIAEADQIDQPTDETTEEELRRLNLPPSVLALAHRVDPNWPKW